MEPRKNVLGKLASAAGLSRIALRTTLLYLLVAGLWIVLSDSILAALVSDAAKLNTIQTYKGSAFVAVTGLMLYTVLRAQLRRWEREVVERRRAEAELRTTSELLRAVAAETSDAIFVKDRDGRYLFVNDATAGFMGQPADSVVGKTDRDFFSDESVRIILERDRLVMEANRVDTAEERLTAGGVTRVFQATKAPYHDGDGRVIGLVGISRDVTDLKREEADRIESQKRLQLALAASTMGVWEWNIVTNVVFWSDECLAIMGVAEFGKSLDGFTRLVHPKDVDRVMRVVRDAIAQRALYQAEFRIVRPNGDIRWVSNLGRAEYDLDGKPLRMTGIVKDITARKHSEAIAERQRQRLEGIIKSAMDGIISVDESLRIVVFNPAAERIFRCRESDALGRTLDEFVPARHREAQRETIRLFGESGEASRATEGFGSSTGLRSGGGEFPIEASISKVEADGQRLYTISCRDMTEFVRAEEERRSLEAQFRQAQKMEAVGQLSSGVAHDFNNILTVIQCNASLILDADGLPSAARDGLAQISHASERAANLTRQLLLFSRKQVMQPTNLDVNEVVASMTKMLQRLLGEDVSLATAFAPKLPPVHADQGMLEQVLLNLAVNARDAMPKGGVLSISTVLAEFDDSIQRIRPEAKPGHFVCLAVTDNRTGIPPEVLPRIFEPFFTTKEVGKGTGLGLATVHGIVHQHGGWLEVKSEQGLGTTFQVYLPAASGRPHDHGDGAPVSRLPGGNETLLVVEDEPALRVLAANILQRCGYKVLTAASGVAALEIWNQNVGDIDLLFTDMIMPDGLTGRELADRLSREKPDLKVIFTSGYSPDITSGAIQLQEGVNFLQKPYGVPKLAAAVRCRLDQR